MVFSDRARRRAPWLLAAVGFALATTVTAQSRSSSSLEGTPSVASGESDKATPAVVDAIRRVWLHNPAVQAAEAKLAATGALADAAGKPLYNPELELTAENADVNTRSVAVSQPLDWSGKRRARAGAAAAEIRAIEAERDQVRQRIALQWLSGFATYRVTSAQVHLGAQRVGLLEQFTALAQRRLTAGDIPQLERDLAELALQEARAQQAGLIADQARARQSVVAVDADSATALPDLPGTLPDMANLPLDEAALGALPMLHHAQAEEEVAQAKVAVTERDRRPDPTISLSGGRVTNGPFSDKVVGINVRIPLFVRNSYSAEVSAARSSADAAAATYIEQRQRAIAEAEQAGASYNALRNAWQSWRESDVASITDRAALLQRLWEAGELSTADYLVQLKQSIDTELTTTGLRARVWLALPTGSAHLAVSIAGLLATALRHELQGFNHESHLDHLCRTAVRLFWRERRREQRCTRQGADRSKSTHAGRDGAKAAWNHHGIGAGAHAGK